MHNIYKMRGHRGKFDVSKPFKLVSNRQQFDALKATDILFPQPKGHSEHAHQQNKEQIVVPKIEVVARITKRRPFAKITPNYIRLPKFLNLPKPDSYELSQVDCLFLKGLQMNYDFEKKTVDQQFLQRAIVELETRAGKDNVIPRSKGWIISFLEKHYKQFVNEPNFERFASQIYNYWRSRRQELKFPLYRPLWRPAENEFNHMLAFKAREKNYRNLRRTNKVDQTDIIQELHLQYRNVGMLCQRIQMRQELKVKNVQLEILSFLRSCRDFVQGEEQYESTIQKQNQISNQMQVAKKMRGQFENFKRGRDPEDNEFEGLQSKQTVNQRQSIANFLATVVYEADRLGISHQNIFETVDKLPFLKNSYHQTLQLVEQAPRVQEQNTKETIQTIMFSMKKYGDLLVRSISDDQSQREQCKQPPKDYLQVKRRRVASSFIGEDDDKIGEDQELRKAISNSFKRYLQLSKQP